MNKNGFLNVPNKKVLLLVPLVFLLTACSFNNTKSGGSSMNPSNLVNGDSTPTPDQSLGIGGSPTPAVAGSSTSTTPTPPSTPAPMVLTRIDKSDPTTKKMVTVTMANSLKFTLTLYPDLAPKTVANFLAKVQSGFYNGLTFHRVEAGPNGQTWVVQGGDPKGDGTGGGQMASEYNNRSFKVGSVGVARGQDQNINNDSQFFITTQDSSFLDKNYTNFGDVTSGMEDVQKIKVGDKIQTIMAQ